MKLNIDKPLLREIAKEFNRFYPFLRIEFPKNGTNPPEGANDAGNEDLLRETAHRLLQSDAGLTDGMTVKELEAMLLALFAARVQVFRKSGKLWIETKMTRDWTLKQQNDRGRELTLGEEG